MQIHVHANFCNKTCILFSAIVENVQRGVVIESFGFQASNDDVTFWSVRHDFFFMTRLTLCQRPKGEASTAVTTVSSVKYNLKPLFSVSLNYINVQPKGGDRISALVDYCLESFVCTTQYVEPTLPLYF